MWIITGATGFIGSALVWELNQKGIDDLVLVDHIPPEKRGGLLAKRRFKEFVLADDLETYLKGNPSLQRLRGIVHMGACSSTTETNEEYLRINNVEYSKMLFHFATEMNIPLIFASSGATYGDGKQGFDDTTDPKVFTPLNLYGWSKLKFDVWALEQKLAPPRWYGLRFFNVYGPNESHKGDMSSVAFKAFHQIQNTGRLRLFRSHNPDYQDGEQLRDFVYVKDITRWMYELMIKPQVQSGIYNMGFGQARSWLDLAKQIFLSLGKPVDIDWMDVPENIRHQYQYFTEAKIDRLKAQQLTPPQWPLEVGVNDYVKNYLLKVDSFL